MWMIRCTQAVMLACLALFAALTAFNNLADPQANAAFVRHVLAMDDIFETSHPARWRAITRPALWQLAYALIIAGEVLTAVLLGSGAWRLWRARHATPDAAARARQWAMAGILSGFLVWYLGFMIIGGEWFLMWQSGQWNGQASAFRFYMTLLAVGIFIRLPES